MNDDIFRGLGVEIAIAKDDDFLKIKETLTRMGIASKRENKLYQSCHILHKRGRYAIMHFKELFLLDNKPTDFNDDDLGRRNTITELLDEWGLVTLVDPAKIDGQPRCDMRTLKVLPFSKKREWELVSKYTIGARP